MKNNQAGVFVSLHKNSELRGCIGTFEPVQDNIAQEIKQNALTAALNDPRFSPLKADELDDLEIKVDVLTSPVPINNNSELDPKKYGILIKSEQTNESGLLLPDLSGVDTIDQQIKITCDKAGIDPVNEKYIIYKFSVERHE